MQIKNVLQYLESIAPPIYQEGYDNAGLLTGDKEEKVTGILCCLDATEAVIEEAISKSCNLVIAHHPIIFKGLKSITGRTYVERVIIKAIRHNIAIYAIHTNLDNVFYSGVNAKIAERLGLKNTRILVPKRGLKKLFAFVPATESDRLRNALFEAGAGAVNGVQHLSYATVGAGTTNGTGLGMVKLEVLFPVALQNDIIAILKNYAGDTSFSYDIITVENDNLEIGAGMIGTLSKPMKEKKFLKYLKDRMQVACIRHTALLGKNISKVALCGGAGGFLLNQAIREKADVFITADYKYHEFFDADGKIIIADIGHYESEQFTIQLLYEVLQQKFRNFALHCTEANTNPVNYYF